MKKQTFATNGMKDRQQFEIIQRTKRTDVRGVKVGGHEVEFGKKSRAALIDDAGLAKAIHDSSGQGGTGDCLVIPVEKQSETFMIDVPWHEE